MKTYEEARQEISNQPGYEATQQLFFTAQGRMKRGPPSPTVSSTATPLEVVPGNTAASSSQTTATPTPPDHTPSLVQPFAIEDHTAIQATAGQMGVDINNDAALQVFLNSKVQTAGDVLRLVTGYHKGVIRPEMYGMVAQLESAIKKVSDHTFTCQLALQFMASENRSQQRHAAGLMLVTTGWPNGLTPPQREFQLGWMLGHTPEAASWTRPMTRTPSPHSFGSASWPVTP